MVVQEVQMVGDFLGPGQDHDMEMVQQRVHSMKVVLRVVQLVVLKMAVLKVVLKVVRVVLMVVLMVLRVVLTLVLLHLGVLAV